jgi:predicted nucleotide-binding protein (sugar kinase/HSP70/actin superfamily)
MPKVLFGGLTRTHEIFLKAFFEFLGYEVLLLPEPDNDSLKIGKIYCNKGQCNPVYYTAGNIIRYLRQLEANGEKDIEKNYFYVTAGSCGPCRFGMYETEYRKAVKDAGFGNFTIIALQQSDALKRKFQELGFNIDKKYFFRFVKTMLIADIINDVYYKIKPYEVAPNSADRWRDTARWVIADTLRHQTSIPRALKQLKYELSTLELDYFVPKPKVKITGEFFSHIQEGDASYRLPSWLIEEGAEPVIEPISTWLEYLVWAKIQYVKERAFRSRLKVMKTLMFLRYLQTMIHQCYNYYRFLIGNKPDSLASQKRLAAYASPYYNTKLAGGEGHMEAGKHVNTIKHRKAHMVISVKPFGCMPSTQSDGVQTKISNDLKNSLFVSVDTTGDAEVNVKSRILMKLYEAQKIAAEEFENIIKKYRIDGNQLDKVRELTPKSRAASLRVPKKPVSTAAAVLRRFRRV